VRITYLRCPFVFCVFCVCLFFVSFLFFQQRNGRRCPPRQASQRKPAGACTEFAHAVCVGARATYATKGAQGGFAPHGPDAPPLRQEASGPPPSKEAPRGSCVALKKQATHKTTKVATLNYSETGQIASDVDKNWCRLRFVFEEIPNMALPSQSEKSCVITE
jgi:hypothetical protein